ncbi:MAG: Kazal-type serine protease inhibitor [Candidatus Micrarchaeota archaeon]
MRTYLIVLLAFSMIAAGCLQGQCPDTNAPVCGEDGNTYKNACLAQRAGVEVASEGACASCKDTDGGKDIFTAGTVSAGGETAVDRCAGGEVVEAYCENGQGTVQNIPCPAGYECDTGMCVKAQCTDSDGGLEEDAKGTVTANGRSQSDECAGAGTVKEYFCENGAASSRDLSCGTGKVCQDGQCVATVCTDSDGKDPLTKGTAKSGQDSYTESCQDSDSVTEYYCENNQLKTEKLDCQSGYLCSDGKCQKALCSDSDNGKDQFKKGMTTYSGTSQTDNCYSDTAVLEYFCATDTSISSEKINCGSGDECFDGRCRPVECAVNQTNVDDEDKRQQLQSYDDGDELRLYAGQAVEINDQMFLKVQSVGPNSTSFRVYLDYEALLDDDEECTATIDEGDSDDDLCGEDTGTIEVNAVDDSEDFADISIDEYYATVYYTQQGVVRDWTDKPACLDDEASFDEYVGIFYPYLDTNNSMLNLDGKKFKLFDTDAEIIEVGTDSFTIEVDGDEVELEDGDTFEYKDEDYEVTLEFNEGGLERFELQS